jgi:hypothetical protein
MLSSSSISQSYSNVPDHSQTGGGYKLNGDLKRKKKKEKKKEPAT